MVNGKIVQTKTIIKVLSGEPLPKKSSAGENANFLKILVQLTDSSKGKEKNQKKKMKKPEYSQSYIKN